MPALAVEAQPASAPQASDLTSATLSSDLVLDDAKLPLEDPVTAETTAELDIADDDSIAVPEPAAAAVAAGILVLLGLMTVLRYRFDHLSAATAPVGRS